MPSALTNTAGQTIEVVLTNPASLVYGQDYTISITRGDTSGDTAAPELSYDSGIGKIRVSDTLPVSLLGTERFENDVAYTVNVYGIGGYKGNITPAVFDLTVKRSDKDIVVADRNLLDITSEAGGNLNAVGIDFIQLQLAGSYGSTITWSSNTPTVIANDGTVTRPSIGSPNAMVTLTASLQKNSAVRAKAFNLIVLALTNLDSTAPDAPTSVQATPGEEKVTLTWVPPVDRGIVRGQMATRLTYTVTGFETATSDNTITSVTGILGTVIEIDSLTAGTEYTFNVIANNGGSLESEAGTVKATPLAVGNQTIITDISYSASTLNIMAGQTITALNPALDPTTVRPENVRVTFGISPTDFDLATGLSFDRQTGTISGNRVSYRHG